MIVRAKCSDFLSFLFLYTLDNFGIYTSPMLWISGNILGTMNPLAIGIVAKDQWV